MTTATAVFAVTRRDREANGDRAIAIREMKARILKRLKRFMRRVPFYWLSRHHICAKMQLPDDASPSANSGGALCYQYSPSSPASGGGVSLSSFGCETGSLYLKVLRATRLNSISV